MTTETTTHIWITVDTSDSAMFGAAGVTTEDPAASIDRFTDLLYDAVHESYPEALVEVRGESGNSHVLVYGGDEDEVRLTVDHLVNTLYQSGDWVVERED